MLQSDITKVYNSAYPPGEIGNKEALESIAKAVISQQLLSQYGELACHELNLCRILFLIQAGDVPYLWNKIYPENGK